MNQEARNFINPVHLISSRSHRLKVSFCIICFVCILGIWHLPTMDVTFFDTHSRLADNLSDQTSILKRIYFQGETELSPPSQPSYSSDEIQNSIEGDDLHMIHVVGFRNDGETVVDISSEEMIEDESNSKIGDKRDLFCRNGKYGIPSILMIGAMKAGTTTLWAALKSQPGVRPGKRKESKFFGQQWWSVNMPHRRHKDLVTNEEYAQTFGECGSEFEYIDATPLSSVLEANPISDMKQFYTEAEYEHLTFIMILQEPVRRFVSQYNFQRKPGTDQQSLRSRISMEINKYVDSHWGEEVDFGLYTRNNYGDIVEQFRKEFPKAKIILIQSQYFFEHEQEVIEGIIRELGHEPINLRFEEVKKNVNMRKKDLLSAKNHDRLVEKFKPQIEKLSSLIDNLGDISIYPKDSKEFISGLMPEKYCHYFPVTRKEFKENVIPIPTMDANDPNITAEYIYNTYYKFNKPFLIKNAAENLFHNYADINQEYLISEFDLTDSTKTNVASGRIVNLFEEKSLQDCMVQNERCVYFRKFHFKKDANGVKFVSPNEETWIRPLHRRMVAEIKKETFMWGINSSGTYNFHISNMGGALPHSHSQAVNVLHQGAKRWIMVSSRDYHSCEDQIDFELHKECPVTRPYKQRYFNRSNICTLTSEQWIERLKSIDFMHYDFTQEAGDLVFVPMTYTHATLDLCSPTIGNVFMGQITAFKGTCLEPDEFRHMPCINSDSIIPNAPKCMKDADFFEQRMKWGGVSINRGQN